MDGGDFDDDDYVDDEDSSWKYRRAAAVSIKSLATVSTDITVIRHLMNVALPVLIERIREHEDSVKMEVINAISAVILAIRSKMNEQEVIVNVPGPVSTFSIDTSDKGNDISKLSITEQDVFNTVDLSRQLVPILTGLYTVLCTKTKNKALSVHEAAVKMKTVAINALIEIFKMTILDPSLSNQVTKTGMSADVFSKMVDGVVMEHSRTSTSYSTSDAMMYTSAFKLLTYILLYYPVDPLSLSNAIMSVCAVASNASYRLASDGM